MSNEYTVNNVVEENRVMDEFEGIYEQALTTISVINEVRKLRAENKSLKQQLKNVKGDAE